MVHSIRRAAGLTTTAVILMAAILPTAAEAQRRQAEPRLQVSYLSDGTLTCEQLTGEISRMEEIAGISAENARNAQTQGAMVDGAASVAVTAALHSGALAAVPGLGMFANFAGQAARRNGEARARAEAERIATAEQRRTLLTGIYQGRQCGAVPAVVQAVASDVPETVAETPTVETPPQPAPVPGAEPVPATETAAPASGPADAGD